MEKQHGGKTTKHLLSYVCSTDAAACEASMKNVHNALKKLPEIEEQETPKDAVEENWMSGTITFSTFIDRGDTVQHMQRNSTGK